MFITISASSSVFDTLQDLRIIRQTLHSSALLELIVII